MALELTSEHRAVELMRLREGLATKASELNQKTLDLEHMTNRSEGQLTRIQELLECEETIREANRVLTDKLTKSTSQITELTEKVKYFEGLASERAADVERLVGDMSVIEGNLNNLMDYIRKLQEELESHGHTISEDPVIEFPEGVQSG